MAGAPRDQNPHRSTPTSVELEARGQRRIVARMANTVALSPPKVDDGSPYVGSRFADVVEALNANPYQRVWAPPASRRFQSTR